MAIAHTTGAKDGSPAPAHLKPLLALVDGQEITRANEACGGRLRPAAIRDATRRRGEIAFSFVVGRPEGIPQRLEEDLIIAGFPIVPFARIDDAFLNRFAHPLARLANLQPVEITLDGTHEITICAIDCDPGGTTANDRRLLVIVDVENLARTLTGAGDELRPAALREAVEEHGEIAFALAVGNVDVDSIPERLWEELAQQGFLPIHSQSLAMVTAGGMVLPRPKNTVDGTMVDLTHRLLRRAEIDGAILVSDDRDFAPAINAIRDRGLWFRRLSARRGGQLAVIGDTIHLALAGEPEVADDRSWAPGPILPHLGRLATLDRRDRGPVFRRMELLQPVVVQALRVLVLDLRDGEALAMDSLVARWHDAIRAVGIRVNVEVGELTEFAHNLVGVNILEEDDDGLIQLRADHPFCRRILNHESREEPRAARTNGRNAPLNAATTALPSVRTTPRRTYFIQRGDVTYYLQAEDEADAVARTAATLARQEQLAGEALDVLRASLRATTDPPGGRYIQL